MGWMLHVFNSILWTTAALIPSIMVGERDLVVIKMGFQAERAACGTLGTEGRQG